MKNKDNINIEEIKNLEVFKVPDNYFDNLTNKIMSNIPAEDANVISINKGKKSFNWLRWTSVAACITVALVGASALFNNNDTNTPIAQETSSSELVAVNQEQDYQEVIDYSMVDVNDVYTYLSGESAY